MVPPIRLPFLFCGLTE